MNMDSESIMTLATQHNAEYTIPDGAEWLSRMKTMKINKIVGILMYS